MTGDVKLAKTQDETLSIYLKQVGKMPLLSREEETEIAIKAANGDKAAKERLITANLRFVISVANKYKYYNFDLLDLIEEGNMGLMEAVERFQPEKGFKFISYAVWWIRKAVLKYISDNMYDIYLPSNRQNDLRNISQLARESEANCTTEDSIRDFAQELGLEENIVRELIFISQGAVSLDAAIADGSDAASFGDLVEDTQNETPEEAAVGSCLNDDVEKVLGSLSTREADILRYRYGLNGKKPLALKEIGLKMNLSKERVRQIEHKAIQMIKSPAYSQNLEAYVA